MSDLKNNNINDLKRCLACSEALPLSSYYSKGKNRIEAICKVCSGKKKALSYIKKKKINMKKKSAELKVLKLIPVIQ